MPERAPPKTKILVESTSDLRVGPEVRSQRPRHLWGAYVLVLVMVLSSFVGISVTSSSPVSHSVAAPSSFTGPSAAGPSSTLLTAPVASHPRETGQSTGSVRMTTSPPAPPVPQVPAGHSTNPVAPVPTPTVAYPPVNDPKPTPPSSPSLPAHDVPATAPPALPTFHSSSPPVSETGTFLGYIPFTPNCYARGAVVDPRTQQLYVACESSGYVEIISTATNSLLGAIYLGGEPYGVAYDSSNGDIFVSEYSSNQVEVISPNSQTVVGGFATGTGTAPAGITYVASNDEIYVDDSLSTTVQVYQATTLSPVTTITVGSDPLFGSLDTATGYLWIPSGGANAVTPINTATNTAGTPVATGTYPWDAIIDSATGDLYVTDSNGNQISVFSISGGTATPLTTLGVTGKPTWGDYDPANGNLYFSDDTNYASFIVSGTSSTVLQDVADASGGVAYDPQNGIVYMGDTNWNAADMVSTELAMGSVSVTLQGSPIFGTVTSIVPTLGLYTRGILYDPSNGDTYVSNYGGSTVTVLSGSTVLGQINVGLSPAGMAYDSADGDIYVANLGAQDLSVISGESNQVVATIPIGSGSNPFGIAYASNTNDLYVVNYTTPGSILVISGATDSMTGKISVGNDPINIVYDSGTGELYVTGYGANDVDEISPVTNSVLTVITGFNLPYGVAYDPYDGDIGVTNSGSGTVGLINDQTNVVSPPINLGSNSLPTGITYDPATFTFDVAETATSNITPILPISSLKYPAIVVTGMPEVLTFDSSTDTLYLVNSSGIVDLISTLLPSTTPGSVVLDYQQSITLSVPVLGQGAGLSVTTLSASPYGGLYCVPIPATEFAAMADCWAGAGGYGSYTITLTVQDTLGNSVAVSISVTILQDPTVTQPTSTRVSVDVGQPITFATTATLGSGSYPLYVWSAPVELGCPGSTSTNSVTCIPTSATSSSWSVSVQVEDSNDMLSYSSTATTGTVYPDPTFTSVTSSRTSLDMGQSVLFSASVTGGLSPYSYGWISTGVSCPSTTTGPANCTAASPGTAYVNVTATDANGFLVTYGAGPITLEVYSDPTLTAVTPSVNSLDVGWGQVVFTATASGGLTPYYNYVWTSPAGLGTCTPTTNILTCPSPTPGTYSVSATVTDKNRYTSLPLASPEVSVYADPVISRVADSRSSLDVGQTITFNATAKLGTGSYTAYHWYAPTDLGCPTTTYTNIIVCTPTTVSSNSWTLWVKVTDSNGNTSAFSTPLSGTLYSQPYAEFGTVPSSGQLHPDVGQRIQVTPVPTGGLAPYSYPIEDTGLDCPSLVTTVFYCTVIGVGPASINMSITDSNGYTSPSPTWFLAFTTYSDPSVTHVVLSTSSVDVGQGGVDFTASATGGLLPYTMYTWDHPAGLGACTPVNNVLSCPDPVPGTYSVLVNVTDNNGFTSTSFTSASVTVYADPYVASVSASRSSIDVGMTGGITFTAVAADGSGNYTGYDWTIPSGLGSCTVSANLLHCASPVVGGPYNVSVFVNDSNGYSSPSVVSPDVTVYADPAVTSVSSSTTSIDVGEAGGFTFTAHAAGGTGIYVAYIWTFPAGYGCAASTSDTLNCLPPSPGTFAVLATVTDSNNYTPGTTSSSTVTIDSDPSMSLSAGSPTADIGQSVTFSGTPSGGSTVYSYFTWVSSTGLSCPSQTHSPTVSCTVLASGSPTVNVMITDTNGFTSGAFTASVTTYSDPVVNSVTLPVMSVDVGQSGLVLTANAAGGLSPYTYIWTYYVGMGVCNLASNTLTCPAPTLPGNYTVSVSVKDMTGFVSSPLSSSPFTIFADPTIAQPTTTRSSMDVGQPVTFTALPGAGTGTYVTYSWTAPAELGCPATSAVDTITCVPISATSSSWVVTVVVTDSNGVSSAPSTGAKGTVYSDPTLGPVSASLSSIDVGQGVQFNVAASGGTTVFTQYSWNVPAGLGCQGPTTSTGSLDCTAVAPGSYTVAVTVVDSNGYTTSASTLSGYTVLSLPSVTIPTPNRSSADVGQTVNFSVVASGGSGRYNFTWSDTFIGITCLVSSPLGNTSSLSCQPGSSGSNFVVTVVVRDSNGGNVSVKSDPFSVFKGPGVASISAGRNSVDVGQGLSFSVILSGAGSGGLTYSWSGLPSGCLGGNTPTVSCVPSTPGNYSVTVTYTDSNGVANTSTPFSVAVSRLPQVLSFTSTAPFDDVGSVLGFSVSASPGSGGLTYSWSGLPAGCSSVTSSASCQLTTTGSGLVTVVVSDTNGGTATSASISYEVYSAPTIVSFSDSRNSVDVGQSDTISVTTTAGSGGLTYIWSGLPTGCLGADSGSLTCAPAAPGTYAVNVEVRDSAGKNASSTPLTLVVFPALSSGSVRANFTSLDLGMSTRLTATVAGGAGPLNYTWSGLPAGCTSATVAQISCQPSSAGSDWVSVSVTDANGASLALGGVSLFVSPALGTPGLNESTATVATSSIVIFAATVTGGSAPLSYTWNGLPSGCVSADAASLSCVPTTPGPYTVTVTVTDGNGVARTSAAQKVTVVASSVTPTSSAFSATDWILLALAVVALLVALVSLVLAGRKKGGTSVAAASPTPAPPPPPPSPPPAMTPIPTPAKPDYIEDDQDG